MRYTYNILSGGTLNRARGGTREGDSMKKKSWTEYLTKEVRAAIQSNWASRGIEGITIEDFTLLKKSDNEYRGILKVSADGESKSLAVNVIVDGDSFMWEIEG
jgi:hypothetical protein